MITINGKTLPNLEYFYTNLNDFNYPKSGTDSVFYPSYNVSGSGTSDNQGLFSIDLFPTDYHIQLGLKNRSNIYYKDLTSGTDEISVDFGGRHTFLSGSDWIY